MPDMKIIVGLGNPGEKYENTRHNVGFRVVDLLADNSQEKWKSFSGTAEISSLNNDGNKVFLAKLLAYMNNSGPVVASLLSYFDILPSQMLVVVDDFSIPTGKLRLRFEGSSGGHNGLSSIIEHLGTQDFPRLRLGIGPVPENVDTKDFVLGRFPSAQKEEVQTMLKDSLQVISNILTLGMEKAISKIGVK